MTERHSGTHLSVIIPTLNEASCISELLDDLEPLRDIGHQVIIVDGGSNDDTQHRAAGRVDRILCCEPGRATQLNAGAAKATGDVLWFVHADSRVTPYSATALLSAVEQGARWGRFDVVLSGRDWRLRVIERMMNLRSCVSGIATGDQGMFVSRRLFVSCGGFPKQPLMEDVALSKILRADSKPACIRDPRLGTSSRRWESRGVVRTVLLMWHLRLSYALGTPADVLARRYR